MTNENDGPSNRGDPTIGASVVSETKPPDPAPSKPATEADLDKVEKRLNGFERSTLRWTRASFGVVLATAVFICLQWLEMRSGGKDTHDLADAAKTQAEKMKSMSDAADKIRQASEGMVTQEQRIADNAQKALDASNRQSKKALDASIDASQLNQKAYVTIGRPDGVVAEILWPQDPKGNAGLLVYFQNNGRLPAKFNWGTDSPTVAIVPTDPDVFSEDGIGKGYAELTTDHVFQPMYRAKNKNTPQMMWSGTIDIAGGSTYQGMLWELPKERMTQLINLDRPLYPAGRFEYCDGVGGRVCKTFHLRYAKEPDARFWLVMEDECSAMDKQIRHPQPDYEYLPVCSTSERQELQTAIPSLPKPE